MVVVMLVSMVAFGALVSMLFAVLGHSNLLQYAALRGLLMTLYMVVGMVVWMRHRHHNWTSIIEMSAAMLLPYVLLVGPLAVGWIGKATFLASMHSLMLPLMFVAMLLRRGEYS